LTRPSAFGIDYTHGKAFMSLGDMLKRVRASQPLNAAATSLARALLAPGRARELARRHLPRVGTIHTRLPDGTPLALWSRGDDGVANDLFWGGFAAYEPETSTTFWRLARTSRCTLDVGAHVGFYSLVAALANRSGRVFAFEPLPQVYERLVRNVRLNRVGNVECIAAAVTDREGDCEFFSLDMGSVPSSSSLSRSFMESSQQLYRRPLVTTRVRALVLDQLVRDRAIERVDLVKLDIETGEAAALRGMRETLARDRPALICEVLPGAPVDALLAVLQPLGYRFLRLSSEGEVAESEIRAVGNGCNYLFVTERSR
jgi:FkbM family methyltransferase